MPRKSAILPGQAGICQSAAGQLGSDKGESGPTGPWNGKLLLSVYKGSWITRYPNGGFGFSHHRHKL